MCLPFVDVLRSLRHAKKIRFLLFDRHVMQRVVRSAGLRHSADGKRCYKLYGYAMVADKDFRLVQQATTGGDGYSSLKA
jgi:hypothetical protein